MEEYDFEAMCKAWKKLERPHVVIMDDDSEGEDAEQGEASSIKKDEKLDENLKSNMEILLATLVCI